MQITPIGLVHALAERIRRVTANIRMEESDGEHVMRAPNVWAQNLPEKLYEDAPDPADYPFILVMLAGGTGIDEGRMPCNIGVLVGGYDDGQPLDDSPGSPKDRQGWMIPAMLAWRIITDMTANPSIGAFELSVDQMSWELPGQEQLAPYWFGIINMIWRVPIPGEEYGLGNMEFRVPSPCESALTGEVSTFLEGE